MSKFAFVLDKYAKVCLPNESSTGNPKSTRMPKISSAYGETVSCNRENHRLDSESGFHIQYVTYYLRFVKNYLEQNIFNSNLNLSGGIDVKLRSAK